MSSSAHRSRDETTSTAAPVQSHAEPQQFRSPFSFVNAPSCSSRANTRGTPLDNDGRRPESFVPAPPKQERGRQTRRLRPVVAVENEVRDQRSYEGRWFPGRYNIPNSITEASTETSNNSRPVSIEVVSPKAADPECTNTVCETVEEKPRCRDLNLKGANDHGVSKDIKESSPINFPPTSTQPRSIVDVGLQHWQSIDQQCKELLDNYAVEAGALEASLVAPLEIDRIAQRIESLTQKQTAEIAAENFAEVENLDGMIQEARNELEALSSACNTPVYISLDHEKERSRLLELMEKPMASLFDHFRSTRRAIAQEAASSVQVANETFSGEIQKLRLESERLGLERDQLETQHRMALAEFELVEQKIAEQTEADQTLLKKTALEKELLDKEIEELRALLARKVAEQHTKSETISACQIRIATTRSKFRKQLSRLKTTLEDVKKAQAELNEDTSQLAQRKSQVLDSARFIVDQLTDLCRDIASVSLCYIGLVLRVFLPYVLYKGFNASWMGHLQGHLGGFVELRRQLKACEERFSDAQTARSKMKKLLSELEAEQVRLQSAIETLEKQKLYAVEERQFREAAHLATERNRLLKAFDNHKASLIACRAEDVASEKLEAQLREEANACKKKIRNQLQTSTKELTSNLQMYRGNLLRLKLISARVRGEVQAKLLHFFESAISTTTSQSKGELKASQSVRVILEARPMLITLIQNGLRSLPETLLQMSSPNATKAEVTPGSSEDRDPFYVSLAAFGLEHVDIAKELQDWVSKLHHFLDRLVEAELQHCDTSIGILTQALELESSDSSTPRLDSSHEDLTLLQELDSASLLVALEEFVGSTDVSEDENELISCVDLLSAVQAMFIEDCTQHLVLEAKQDLPTDIPAPRVPSANRVVSHQQEVPIEALKPDSKTGSPAASDRRSDLDPHVDELNPGPNEETEKLLTVSLDELQEQIKEAVAVEDFERAELLHQIIVSRSE